MDKGLHLWQAATGLRHFLPHYWPFVVCLININIRPALSAIAENENCLYQMFLSSARSSVIKVTVRDTYSSVNTLRIRTLKMNAVSFVCVQY